MKEPSQSTKPDGTRANASGVRISFMAAFVVVTSGACFIPLTSSSGGGGADATGIGTFTVMGSCNYPASDFCQDEVGDALACPSIAMNSGGPCTAENLVGSCRTDKGTAIDQVTRYYAPLYTTESSRNACANLGGTFATGSGPSTPTEDAGGVASDRDAGTPPPITAAPSILGFTPSNVAGVLGTVSPSSLMDMVIDATATIPILESTCSIAPAGSNGCLFRYVAQPGGGTIAVYVARSWTVEAGATLQVGGSLAALVALETIDIAGTVTSSGYLTTGEKGAGTPGGVGNSSSTSFGAGGGSFCGAGGRGGGTAAVAGAGAPPAPYGTTALVPLISGSQGGAAITMGTDYTAGDGGHAIQLVAGQGVTVEVGGMISMNGGGGRTAAATPIGAGGGSGGAILIEAPTVTIRGAVTANGGGGAGGSPMGASGQTGTSTSEAAPGGSAGTAWAGGDGAAGLGSNGTNGAGGDATDYPGGGGGAAGRIRINATSYDAPGVLSPSAGSGCFYEGALSP